jgi:hypothetical protein
MTDASESPPASSPAPASPPPASTPPDSSGCAEIPAAPHAVLEAAIQLIVHVTAATDLDAAQGSHKLTLTNEDGSYSKTLDLAADAKPGDTADVSVLTFEGLTDGHTYKLEGEDGDGKYVVFDATAYHEIVTKLAKTPAAEASAPPPSE